MDKKDKTSDALKGYNKTNRDFDRSPKDAEDEKKAASKLQPEKYPVNNKQDKSNS